MNVTVLRQNPVCPSTWTMLFRDQEFGDGNIGAIIHDVKQNFPCEAGDELIVIMDDRVNRVTMVPATLEAVWFPMKKGPE